ncbi:uncharacterized protein OCT59_001498 [Rhizophagus irregularis]|uniref:uncharacterized protein n=1 Tax=Rhizophagus irregularis TaxID=588596 RepID=UPI00331C01A4|nr:hypothetical protein OCT59_001498 [Rhizophagus irregularis]
MKFVPSFGHFEAPDFTLKIKEAETEFRAPISKLKEAETEFWAPISKLKEAETEFRALISKLKEAENEFWSPISKIPGRSFQRLYQELLKIAIRETLEERLNHDETCHANVSRLRVSVNLQDFRFWEIQSTRRTKLILILQESETKWLMASWRLDGISKVFVILDTSWKEFRRVFVFWLLDERISKVQRHRQTSISKIKNLRSFFNKLFDEH